MKSALTVGWDVLMVAAALMWATVVIAVAAATAALPIVLIWFLVTR